MSDNRHPNAFFLHDIPDHTAPERDGDTILNYGPKALWSGLGPVPRIGDRVLITMNGLGPGAVRAYFVESGWLGLHVELEAPPAWWLKQTKHLSGAKRWATVFGMEVAAGRP